MNVLFYLIPKKDVYFLESDCTIRQALEKMEYHHYSSIPVLNKNGEYVSSLSDGDLLWYIKNHALSLKDVEDHLVSEIPVHRHMVPIKVDANILDLADLIVSQNYVPVIDDRNIFIGIVTRKRVIQELIKNEKNG